MNEYDGIIKKTPLNTTKKNKDPNRPKTVLEQQADLLARNQSGLDRALGGGGTYDFGDDGDVNPTLKAAPPGGGVMNTSAEEYPKVKFFKTDNAKVIQGKKGANCYIVLGGDRPSHDKSGYSGKGGNRANSIDMVVGRMASARKGKGPQDDATVHNSFSADAARIYMSQMTDIDKNFGLAEGNWEYLGPRSAIGMKADQIRIVGRESVKIVTGKCIGCEGYGWRGETNSFGGKIPPAGPIELIAGNNTSDRWIINMKPGTLVPKIEFVDRLQPIPLGKNLRDCLADLWSVVGSIWQCLHTFLLTQNITNTTTTITTALFDAPSHAIVGSLMTLLQQIFVANPQYHNRTNGTMWEQNYLKPTGNKYICSRNVRTT